MTTSWKFSVIAFFILTASIANAQSSSDALAPSANDEQSFLTLSVNRPLSINDRRLLEFLIAPTENYLAKYNFRKGKVKYVILEPKESGLLDRVSLKEAVDKNLLAPLVAFTARYLGKQVEELGPVPPILWIGAQETLDKITKLRSPWLVTQEEYENDLLVIDAIEQKGLELPDLDYVEPNENSVDLDLIAVHPGISDDLTEPPYTVDELIPLYRELQRLRMAGRLDDCSEYMKLLYSLSEIRLRSDFVASYYRLQTAIPRNKIPPDVLEKNPGKSHARPFFAALERTAVDQNPFPEAILNDDQAAQLKRLNSYVHAGWFTTDSALILLLEEGGSISSERYQEDFSYRELVRSAVPEIATEFDRTLTELDAIDRRAAQLAKEFYEKNRDNFIYPAHTGDLMRILPVDASLPMTADGVPNIPTETYQRAPFQLPEDDHFEQQVRRYYRPEFSFKSLKNDELFSIMRLMEDLLTGFEVYMGPDFWSNYEIPGSSNELLRIIKAEPGLQDAQAHHFVEAFLYPNRLTVNTRVKHVTWYAEAGAIGVATGRINETVIDLSSHSILYSQEQWDYFWQHLKQYEADDAEYRRLMVDGAVTIVALPLMVSTAGAAGLGVRALGSLALRGIILHEAGVALTATARSLQYKHLVLPTVENLTIDPLRTGLSFALGGWASGGIKALFPALQPLLANSLGFASSGFSQSLAHGESLASASVGAVKVGSWVLFGGVSDLAAQTGGRALLSTGYRVYLANTGVSAVQGAVEYELGGFVDDLGMPAENIGVAVAVKVIGSGPMDFAGARAASTNASDSPQPTKGGKIIPFPLEQRRAQAALEIESTLAATGTDATLPIERPTLTLVANKNEESPSHNPEDSSAPEPRHDESLAARESTPPLPPPASPDETTAARRLAMVEAHNTGKMGESWATAIRAEDVPESQTIRLVAAKGTKPEDAEALLEMFHGCAMDISQSSSMRKWLRLFGEQETSRSRARMWTHRQISGYENYTKVAAGAPDIPNHGVALKIDDFDDVIDWGIHYLQARKAKNPNKLLFVLTRSSTAVFVRTINQRVPGLIDGMIFVNPSFWGDHAIIEEEVAGAYEKIRTKGGVLYEDKLNWIKRMLETPAWDENENFGGIPTLILTSDQDLEVSDQARQRYTGLAERFPNVRHHQFSSTEHDFLSVDSIEGRDEALRGLKIIEDMFRTVVDSKE